MLELSRIKCTSSRGGTRASMVVRNLRNSRARWRWWNALITLPLTVLNAANNVVVPYRV